MWELKPEYRDYWMLLHCSTALKNKLSKFKNPTRGCIYQICRQMIEKQYFTTHFGTNYRNFVVRKYSRISICEKRLFLIGQCWVSVVEKYFSVLFLILIVWAHYEARLSSRGKIGFVDRKLVFTIVVFTRNCSPKSNRHRTAFTCNSLDAIVDFFGLFTDEKSRHWNVLTSIAVFIKCSFVFLVVGICQNDVEINPNFQDFLTMK